MFIKKYPSAQFTMGFGAVYKGVWRSLLGTVLFFLKKIYFSKKVNFGVVYKGAPRSLSKPVNASKSDHGFY